MPKTYGPPKYRHYKPKDLAVVRIDGKDHYLGPYGSPESREKYGRLVAEWQASRPLVVSNTGEAPEISVNELVRDYMERRVLGYYRKDGKPTSEVDNIRQALRFVVKLYGLTPARRFGPLALKAVRETMISAGRCRKLINSDVHRVRGFFRWATSEELFPPDQLVALDSVRALEKGRSAAKERPPVRPVAEATVLATLPHLGPQLAAMVHLQLLTAARPGEVVIVRPCDVDRSDPASWVYRPGSHKTEHHGKERVIVLGPRAQAVLAPWLDRPPTAYCFSPAEVVAAREAARKATTSRAARPKRGGRYTKDSYRVAINRACDRAFPHPTIAAIRASRRTDEQVAELDAWRKQHRWHPQQLRHTKATEIRARFDTESAQVILGHSKPDTTIIYAERDLARARGVMGEIG